MSVIPENNMTKICLEWKNRQTKLKQYIPFSFEVENERKSEHAPTLLEKAVYNEWQFQALVMGKRTETSFIRVTQNNFGQSSKGI